MRTAYPSIEIYAYGADGSVRPIYTKSESGNLNDLKHSDQPIPAVSPRGKRGTMGVRAVYWLMVALVATPALLLAVAWVLSFREGKGKVWRSGWVLPIATGSVGWAIIAWNMPPALGPTYSNVRYAIIDCNFLAMLGCSIVALRSKAAKAKVAGVACVAATVLWGLVAAVNSIA